MAEIIKMPKLSDTMTDGTVAAWHKKVGDKVKSGDLLAEIETDKATMEFESFQDGVLLYIGVEKGGSAPVDSVLAILGKEGEDYKAALESAKSEPKAEDPSTKAQDEKTNSQGDKKEEKKSEEKTEVTISASSNGGGRVKASPLAKALAKNKGINISQVKGSGDGGRIIKKDIENFKGGSSGALTATESFTEVAVSNMRKTIARRLSESKNGAPHFYLTMAINMDQAIATRKAFTELTGEKISFNDMVVKAVAMALRKHPAVNSSWLGDKIRYNNHIHIGVAVAVPDGLVVPVVKFADHKSFTEISAEVKTFAAKAKDKKIQPADMEGNTFSISNLGMYGIDSFTAIINPPDACILAVGGITEEPVVKDGAVVPGNIMKVTLSCDHRVVDGATGSEFLRTFKLMMENPVLMFA
jgi:pyruvate dehydrogenase E2 component (dihydrolipoamide acetyltransferase)